jgi:hypothetical protein
VALEPFSYNCPLHNYIDFFFRITLASVWRKGRKGKSGYEEACQGALALLQARKDLA